MNETSDRFGAGVDRLAQLADSGVNFADVESGGASVILEPSERSGEFVYRRGVGREDFGKSDEARADLRDIGRDSRGALNERKKRPVRRLNFFSGRLNVLLKVFELNLIFQ